jgi:drug/metabolite transporter (DMT)-like permease
MTGWRLGACVALALAGFAGNSLLCRAALRDGAIDAASFTALRLGAGAVLLWLLAALRRGGPTRPSGNWPGATALFAYAALFSFAYLRLDAASGALLLFGAVQATMLARGLRDGERFHGWRGLGIALACAGLLVLLLPGAQAPEPLAAAAMLGAGVAWGLYSLQGRRAGDPLADTAGNFLRALPFALLLVAGVVAWRGGGALHASREGIWLALASGALASGLGYALWYAALPALRAGSAATLQLAVPVLAAAGGVLLLGEPLGLRAALAAAAVLGGIALVVQPPRAGPVRS